MGQWDQERSERDFRLNPPTSAPGLGGEDGGWGDDMLPQQSSSINTDSFMGAGSTDVNSILNGMSGVPNQSAGKSPEQLAREMTSTEDKVFEVATKAGKGLWSFFSQMIKSLMNNTKGDWHNYGVMISKIAMGWCVFGIFFSLLKPFVPSIKQPSDAVVSGMLQGIVGVLLMMYFPKSSEGDGISSTPSGFSGGSEVTEAPIDLFSSSDLEEGVDAGEDDYGINDDAVEDEDFDWDSVMDEYLGEEDDGGSESAVDIDAAIENVENTAQPGIYTRQYLFETFCSVLPKITPGFSRMEQISEASDEFMEMSELLRSAAYQVGTKEENVPDLLEMRKNIFIIQLRATRPAGLKEQEIADCIADGYSRDADSRRVREGIYATVDSTVGIFIINIFLGNEAMVSLRDVYGEISNFVLDTDVKMPFVWGVDELGTPLYCDLKDCDSIIISGEPRSGKSWKGQSVVAQLAMYSSPKEVQFYVFDIKDVSSDYRMACECLPHAKYFCGDPNKINAGIKKLIDVTNSDTGKILAESNFKNIKDYNRKHPDNKLPYKYIVIDEMMALMNGYDKDQQAEFKGLLSTIVSKMAYLGVRVIMFPHRIVDNVISKNTYSLVSSRAVVRQLNYEELKNAMGVTHKEFPYNLNNVGDMALKTKEIAKGRTIFCHAEVLTPTNEGNDELFKFIGAVWKKLEPDCKGIEVHGSIGDRIAPIRECENTVEGHGVVDHTAGREEYTYTGYSSAYDLSEMDGGDSSLGESEDDFWDEILKNS